MEFDEHFIWTQCSKCSKIMNFFEKMLLFHNSWQMDLLITFSHCNKMTLETFHFSVTRCELQLLHTPNTLVTDYFEHCQMIFIYVTYCTIVSRCSARRTQSNKNLCTVSIFNNYFENFRRCLILWIAHRIHILLQTFRSNGNLRLLNVWNYVVKLLEVS